MIRFAWSLVIGLTLIVSSSAVAQYRTHAQIGQLLLDAQTNYPAICARHSLGISHQGRQIWALRITDNLGLEEDEPEVKLISTMHGDEWVGNEMCLYLIDHITSNYGSDSRITEIVNETDLWIVPLMNPDGFESASPTRYNAQGYDLNRNFPDWYTSPSNTPAGRPTEIGVIMNWSFDHAFVLSANMHGGALVVNYPFDNDDLGSVFSPSPDEDLFFWMSEQYSQHNLPMWNSSSFTHGITNGAAWYSIDGGMQDWNYRYMGCNAVTLELSNVKIPSSSLIPDYWDDNLESILAYIETVYVGVRGVVTEEGSGLPLAATVRVEGRDHDVFTDADVGDFHRMLMPGTYGMTVSADAVGYDEVTVDSVLVGAGDATRMDITLGAPAEVASPNGAETLVVGVPTTVTWTGSGTQPFQVQYTLDADAMGTESFDFETGPLDPRFVHEGDGSWYRATGAAHGGAYALRAGGITHNEESVMSLAVQGGPISFWYRVSSEPGYDYFRFYIDDTLEVEEAGTVGWTQYSTVLPAGSYELTWTYSKDINTSNGSDTAWIDDLSVSLDAAVWTDIVGATLPGASSASWTPPAESDGALIRVRTLYGSSGHGLWDVSDAAFTIGSVSATGDADVDGDVDMRDYFAFLNCLGTSPTGLCMDVFDFVPAGSIDLMDYDQYYEVITGPVTP